jgi:hypothetical protein
MRDSSAILSLRLGEQKRNNPLKASNHMPIESNTLEALKLVSDWAKWLVTIETGAIAILGTMMTSTKSPVPRLAKFFGTVAMVCMLTSIAAAAVLLLTLPEIAQYLRPETNIWMNQDSVVASFLRMNTQSFAILESVFFGLGLVFAVASIVTVMWSKTTTPNTAA